MLLEKYELLQKLINYPNVQVSYIKVYASLLNKFLSKYDNAMVSSRRLGLELTISKSQICNIFKWLEKTGFIISQGNSRYKIVGLSSPEVDEVATNSVDNLSSPRVDTPLNYHSFNHQVTKFSATALESNQSRAAEAALEDNRRTSTPVELASVKVEAVHRVRNLKGTDPDLVSKVVHEINSSNFAEEIYSVLNRVNPPKDKPSNLLDEYHLVASRFNRGFTTDLVEQWAVYNAKKGNKPPTTQEQFNGWLEGYARIVRSRRAS